MPHSIQLPVSTPPRRGLATVLAWHLLVIESRDRLLTKSLKLGLSQDRGQHRCPGRVVDACSHCSLETPPYPEAASNTSDTATPHEIEICVNGGTFGDQACLRQRAAVHALYDLLSYRYLRNNRISVHVMSLLLGHSRIARGTWVH